MLALSGTMVSASNQILATPSGSNAIQVPCPTSGTATATLQSLTPTTRADGTSQLSVVEQLGFTDCVSNGVSMQGNPSMTLTSQFSFGPSGMVYPVVLDMTGGILFTENSVQGTLQFNCTMTVPQAPATATMTGTLTVAYPIGSTPLTIPCGD